MDTLGIEPRASRMLSGCDTTTPRARSSLYTPERSVVETERSGMRYTRGVVRVGPLCVEMVGRQADKRL